jgi:hypothetical protein
MWCTLVSIEGFLCGFPFRLSEFLLRLGLSVREPIGGGFGVSRLTLL